jgi:hypothetical protein
MVLGIVEQRAAAHMILEILVLVALFGVLIGVLPWWWYSRWWGYGPSALIGVILLTLLTMTLLGGIPGQ